MKKTFDELKINDVITDHNGLEWKITTVDGDMVELETGGPNVAVTYKDYFAVQTYEVTAPPTTFTVTIPGDWDAENYYHFHLQQLETDDVTVEVN